MNGKGVIFDMDGVLVDSFMPHFESWRLVAQRYGVTVTERMFREQFGRTGREIARHWWGQDVTDDQIQQWDGEKEEAYREILQARFPAMDGAGELLVALHKAGFKLAIGSSGPKENIAVVRQCLGGADLFDASVTGHDVHFGKPHPEVFLKAAGKLGLAPAQCCVVEDAPFGVEAARRAGMAVVAILGTAPREQLADAGMVIHSHRELTPEKIGELIAANAGEA
jgi:beta-phosphoglucomutase